MNVYMNLSDIRETIADENQLYIYVLQNYPQGNIKIGRTTNPAQRFRSLSGSNNGGNKILRVAISPMTYLYSIETTCHTHFDRNRIPNTEYFEKLSFEEVVQYIDDIFNSKGYVNCNQVRKEFYEKNPNRIPKFLIKNEEAVDIETTNK